MFFLSWLSRCELCPVCWPAMQPSGKAEQSTTQHSTLPTTDLPCLLPTLARAYTCACLPALQDTKRGSVGCGVFAEIPAKAISQHQLGALPQNYMLIQLTDASPEKQREAAQQGSCSAADMAGADKAGADRVIVAAQLPDGSWRQFEGILAEFGPVFEPGCGGVSDDSSTGGASSGSSSGGGKAAAASKQQAAAAAGAAESAPVPLQWQGQPLVLRQGGPRERPYRMLYLADSSSEVSRAEAEDDPYLDPEQEEDDDEEEIEEGEGGSRGSAGSAASRAAAAATGGDGSDGDDEEVEDGDEVYADGLDDEPGPDTGSSGGGGSIGGNRAEDDIYPVIYPVLCSAEATAVAAQPLDGCSTLQNAAELNGSIAILQRGRWVGGRGRRVASARGAAADLCQHAAAPGHQTSAAQ
jgi:hypothetical protein